MSRDKRQHEAQERATDKPTRDDVHEQRQPNQPAPGLVDEHARSSDDDEEPPETEPEWRREAPDRPSPGANSIAHGRVSRSGDEEEPS